ncbi:WD40 repeat domain-containing protein, partial [Archangium gephyra]
ADGRGTPIVLSGHEGIVRSAVFSPDGQHIITASDDKTARVWPLAISDISQRLREANRDCLSPELRLTFLGESDSQALRAYEECERSYGRVLPRPPSVAGASVP